MLEGERPLNGDDRGLERFRWANRSHSRWFWGRTSVSSGLVWRAVVPGVMEIFGGDQGADRHTWSAPGRQKPVRLTQPETRLPVHLTRSTTPLEQGARTTAGLTASLLVHLVDEQQDVQRAAEAAPQRANPVLRTQPGLHPISQSFAQHFAHELTIGLIHRRTAADHQHHPVTVGSTTDSTRYGSFGTRSG
jgi:hypothetical protein